MAPDRGRLIPMDPAGRNGERRLTSAAAPGAWWIAPALFLLVILLFWPAAEFGFTSFDDPRYITDNPMVREGLTPESVRQAFGVFRNEYWIPVTWLSLMTDVALFGPGPRGFHITNVLLHAANTGLIFLLLLSMTRRTGLSALTAVLFAAHPLRVEAVAWIVERKGLLAAFFLLLALAAYLRYIRRQKAGWYIVMATAYALSLMAKPLAVTFPLLLLVLDYWPLSRLKGRREPNRPQLTAGFLVLEKTPLLLAGAAFSWLTLLTQAPQRHAWTGHFSPVNNLGRGALAVFVYLRDLIWPAGLGVKFYDLTGAGPSGAAMGAVVLALIALTVILVLSTRRVAPALAAGWSWYLIALAPVSGVIPVGIQWTADRFTYVPHILLLAGLVWTADRFLVVRTARMLVLGAVLIMIASWSVATRHQLGFWQDAVSLASRSVDIAPDNVDAGLFLAGAYGREDLDRAVAEYRRILAVHPEAEVVHFRLGLTLNAGGQWAEAARHLQESVNLAPGRPGARLALADTLFEMDRLDEAAGHYLDYLGSEPEPTSTAYVHNQLGLIARRLDRHAASAEEFRNALEQDPENGLYHFNLALALTSLENREEAIFHYKEALRIDPEDDQARLNLAEQLYRWDRRKDAADHFGQITRRRSGTAEAFFAMGRLAEMDGDMEEARIRYRQGLAVPAAFPQIRAALERSLGGPDGARRSGN